MKKLPRIGYWLRYGRNDHCQVCQKDKTHFLDSERFAWLVVIFIFLMFLISYLCNEKGKNIGWLLLGLTGLLFPNEAFSQGPPIFTDTPIMLGLEGGGVRTFGNIINKENADVYTHILAIPYNITNQWQVGGIIPFVSISHEGMESRSGISDIKLFTKYQIYQKDGKAKTLRGLVKLTETFPTGNSTESPALGTGAYQTTISLVNGYITTRYGLYTEFGYNLTSDGLPDNFIYNLAFGYPILPQQYPPRQINLFLELNGNYIFNDIGNNLFITPGIQYIVGRRVLFESGIQLPLDEAAIENQQTNFVLRIGTRILIF